MKPDGSNKDFVQKWMRNLIDEKRFLYNRGPFHTFMKDSKNMFTRVNRVKSPSKFGNGSCGNQQWGVSSTDSYPPGRHHYVQVNHCDGQLVSPSLKPRTKCSEC